MSGLAIVATVLVLGGIMSLSAGSYLIGGVLLLTGLVAIVWAWADRQMPSTEEILADVVDDEDAGEPGKAEDGPTVTTNSERPRAKGAHASQPDLALVDVETTGFAYKQRDRIVEIGIIRTDFWGEKQATFETLINPGRDVGPTHIHGITAEMVKDAPAFEDVAGAILEMLDGAYMVAHNAQFDGGFLAAELDRAEIHVGELPGYCTLQFSQQIFPDLPSKKLERLCEFLDIEVDRPHAALSDAQATHRLLDILREERPDLISDSPAPIRSPLPAGVQMGAPLTRDEFEHRIETRSSPLDRLMARLPSVETEGEGPAAYADLLDEVLRDRFVSDEEVESLADLADEYGLSKSAAKRVYLRYLENLIRYALLDETITANERQDIEKVQRLLGLQDRDLDLIIDEVSSSIDSTYEDITSSIDEDLKGKSVCFTGALAAKIDGEVISRATAQKLADERGMVPKKRVTKSLDYLVAADPHTQSGKAEKARKYEIPILTEAEFWRKLGVQVR